MKRAGIRAASFRCPPPIVSRLVANHAMVPRTASELHVSAMPYVTSVMIPSSKMQLDCKGDMTRKRSGQVAWRVTFAGKLHLYR